MFGRRRTIRQRGWRLHRFKDFTCDKCFRNLSHIVQLITHHRNRIRCSPRIVLNVCEGQRLGRKRTIQTWPTCVCLPSFTSIDMSEHCFNNRDCTQHDRVISKVIVRFNQVLQSPSELPSSDRSRGVGVQLLPLNALWSFFQHFGLKQKRHGLDRHATDSQTASVPARQTHGLVQPKYLQRL